jgi:alpha-glucoside transport system substrate-binding protein
MDKRRRPGIRFLAALATVTLVATACTGGDGGGTTAEPPSDAPSAPVESMAPSESAAESMAPSESAGAGFQFEQLGGSVSVLATWTDSEQDSFMAMIQPWVDGTGVQVDYTGSRDLATLITTGIASGNLPDVAGLPGPGQMADWYDQGALKPLDFVDFDTYASSTPAGFADLGKAADGTLTGIFTKGAVKGLIWYNTAVWTGDAPTTWDELTAAADGLKSGDTRTWCIGFESGGDSGWPGTDWIEDIVLRQAGPDVYDQWVAGELPWTSPEIKAAFETLGTALQDAHGGSDFIVTTNFGRAANPMFDDPPGCLLHHQASFITDFFANEAGATPEQYDFFPFPDINASFAGSVTGGGDLVGMFNDTPQARSLIQWLLTPEAQQIWVERGGFISANKNVPLEAYPDEASRQSAEILANAQTFRFDGSDRMPSEMNKAFFSAMVELAQNPTNVDPILQQLDTVQADAYNQ